MENMNSKQEKTKKKRKMRWKYIIVIVSYIISSIYIGITAYRFYVLGDHLVAMAVPIDLLFVINTQIHMLALIIVFVCNKLYKLLLKWAEN